MSGRTTKKPTLDEQFAEFAGHLDIEMEIVKNRYQSILDEKKNKFPELPEKVLIPTSVRLLKTDLKRDFGSLISKAPPVRGFFAGSSELVDFIDRMRQKALRESGKNQEAFDMSVASGLINSDGVPLDTRPKYYNDANPWYGHPLDDIPEEKVIESHRRTLYAVGYRKGSEQVEFFAIDFNGAQAVDLEYELFAPKTWRANIAKEGIVTLQRATPAATRIRNLEQTFDFEKMIDEACEIVPLCDFPNWHLSNVDDWDRVICGKANAAVIADEPHPTTGSLMIILDDETLGFEDMGHRLYVPDYMEVDFGEETDIYFWGRTGYQTLRATEEQIVVTNAFGMMAVGVTATQKGYRSKNRVAIEWDDAVE